MTDPPIRTDACWASGECQLDRTCPVYAEWCRTPPGPLTIVLSGGWHDGLTVPLPPGMAEPDLYVLPAPTPGLDEYLARDRREIYRHVMTRVVVYRRRLPGIYAWAGTRR